MDAPGGGVGRIARAVIVAVAVLAATAASLSGPMIARASTQDAAEHELLGLINDARAARGLIAVRPDSRLTAIARARSADMARYHYFGHRQPDGRTVFDILDASPITWYGAGEVLAWDTGYPSIDASAAAARDGWLASASHREVILSRDYNYVGFGYVLDGSTGKRLWTGVFMRGPDRTGGWVRLQPTLELSAAGTLNRRYRIDWTGGDIPLSALTAGLDRYQLQLRADDTSWHWWTTGTTVTYRDLVVWRGHWYDVRVRACDRRGNCGAWRSVRVGG